VAQVEQHAPERTRLVLTELYEVSLDLLGHSLIGGGAKAPWVGRVWSDLLPTIPHLLSRFPRQAAARLSNAVHNIGSQHGARPADWIARMVSAAPQCQSIEELTEVGKVAAWLAGMPQYRGAALDACRAMRPDLAAVVLGLPEATDASALGAAIDRLRDNWWLPVEAALTTEANVGLRQVAIAGAFTGFGGLFHRPPLAGSEGESLWVSDGEAHFELIADAYGIWFRRTAKQMPTGKTDAAIDREGILRWGKLSLRAPQLAGATSIAASGQTLAVTIPTSHHIFLFSNR
jgi:hypothetical protein